QGLTLNANGSGTVTFGGAVGTTALASLSVTGAARINAASVRTIGTQTYNGAITLGGTSSQVKIQASTLTLSGNIEAASGITKHVELACAVHLNANTAIVTNGGFITLGGNIDAAGKNVDFNTRAANPADDGLVYITEDVTIDAAAAVKFYNKVTDEIASTPFSYYDKELVIINTGAMNIEDINLFRFKQAGDSSLINPGGAVIVGARNQTRSSDTNWNVRSTSTLITNSDYTLETNWSIIDKGGVTEFRGKLMSAAGKFYSISIENLGLGGAGGKILVNDDVGDAAFGTASKRLGLVEFKADEIDAKSIYSTDDIKFNVKNSTFLKIIDDLTLDARSDAVTHKNILMQSDSYQNGDLTVLGGFVCLDNNNYQLGGSTPVTVPNGFTGAGALTLAAGVRFIVGLPGGSSRNVNLTGGSLDLSPESTLVMKGNGTISVLNSNLGSFEIGTSGAVSASSNLTLKGDWTQTLSTNFTPGSYTVTFKGDPAHKIITISGNTVWYNFVVDNSQQDSSVDKILFSNYQSIGDEHKFTGNIKMYGTSTKLLTITRKDDSGGGIVDPPYIPTLATLPAVPDQNFWVINVSGANNIDFDNIEVFHSYASTEIINVSPVKVKTGVKAPYWTINWNNEFFYLFAFTEDTDGDGRIDRLRIQPSVSALKTTNNLNIPSGLKIEVEGYELGGIEGDLSNPRYWLDVLAPSPAPPGSYKFLFVKLKPHNKPDTNAVPKWRLIAHGDVIDAYIGAPVGVPPEFENGFPSTDTAPARVVYSLLHGDTGELYVRFSEPVNNNFPSLSVIGGGLDFNAGSPAGEDGARFSPSAPYNIAQTILDDRRYKDDQFNNAGTSGREYGWPVYPQSLMQWCDPEYPGNPLYSSYIKVRIRDPYPGELASKTEFSGIFDLQGRMLVQAAPSASPWYNARRLSDVMVLPQPNSAPPTAFWPVWAANTTALASSPHISINQWDGSSSIIVNRNWQANDIFANLEFFIKNSVSGLSTPPDFLFAFDVQNRYRQGGAAGKLWLPPTAYFQNERFDPVLGIVPDFFNTSTTVSGSGSTDFTYILNLNNLNVKGVFDFIFKIKQGPLSTYPVYAVMLDSKFSSGAWWEGLRPFSFIIRDIVRQKGGVSIINNVINPVKGDETTISYVLSKSGQVTINVFTMDGVVVKTLERGHLNSGEHFVRWNGRNNAGNAVARGMYFVRIVGPEIDEIRKIMLVK
ncbi:MAG: hypothetical protein LBG79_02275, partial [Spirochaetaceae bacterium]|nr:hypothetical protein [Spirochaetaceae bacterium]